MEQLLGSPPAHPPAQPGPEVSTRRVWEEPAKLSLEVCDGLFQPVVKEAREAPCFVSSLVHFPCVQQKSCFDLLFLPGDKLFVCLSYMFRLWDDVLLEIF